ncbi:MAG: endonuclease III [Candidatus Bathyarchaeia archaeon]
MRTQSPETPAQQAANVSKSERARAREILKILRETLPIRDEDFASVVVAKESSDPFRVLVVTILSQNCTDIAAMRAYRNLDRLVGVTVSRLAGAPARMIQRAIKVAGLHKQKARALRDLARQVAQEYAGHLTLILHGPDEVVRTNLQVLPKVGPKTADVLLNILGKPTISVDTHVNRVSKRLGLAPPKAKYEDIRAALMRLFSPREYPIVPLLFMAHGRKTCKARRPLCPICPVRTICPYSNKTRPL